MHLQSLHDGQSAYRIIGYNTLIFFVLLPGIRAIFKYLPEYAWLVVIAEALAVIFVANSGGKWNKKLFGNAYLLTLLLMLATLALYMMYPVADGLKAVMRGSDQDDCVVLGALRLLAGQNPYLDLTYFGNPCSTGFGVLLYYLPFVLFNAYFLGGIFSIVVVMAALLRSTGRLEDAGFFFFLLFSCVAVPELLVVGSDLIFVGSGIALLVLLVRPLADSKQWGMLFLSALLCGVLASSRVNFLVLVPLIAFLLFSRWRSGAFLFVVFGAIIAFLPSLLIYLSDPQAFTPLHLLHKAQVIMPRGILIVAALVSVGMAIVGYFMVRRSAQALPLAVFLSLLPGLLTLSLGDLYGRGWNPALWEGANYLIPLLPIAALLVVEQRKSAGIPSHGSDPKDTIRPQEQLLSGDHALNGMTRHNTG